MIDKVYSGLNQVSKKMESTLGSTVATVVAVAVAGAGAYVAYHLIVN